MGLFSCIQSFKKSKMGCASTRDAVYIPNENNQFPSLIIDETACQLENVGIQFVPSACGYIFALNHSQQNAQLQVKLLKNTQKPENNLIDQAKAKFIDLQKAYKEAKIDEAYRQLIEIQALTRENNLDLSILTSQSERKAFISLSERIKQQNEYLKTIESQISSTKWQFRIEEDIIIKRKKEDNKIQILLQGQANNQMKLMIALFGSLERSASILKFAESSREIQREDMFNKIGKIMFDCPLSKKQQKHFALTIFNRFEKDKSVIISYRSLLQNNLLCERFNYWLKNTDNPAINICNITLRLQEQEKSIKIQLLFEFQAFFKDIADWVLERLFENMALSTFSNLLFQSSPNSSPQIKRATQFKSVSELESYYGTALKPHKK